MLALIETSTRIVKNIGTTITYNDDDTWSVTNGEDVTKFYDNGGLSYITEEIFEYPTTIISGKFVFSGGIWSINENWYRSASRTIYNINPDRVYLSMSIWDTPSGTHTYRITPVTSEVTMTEFTGTITYSTSDIKDVTIDSFDLSALAEFDGLGITFNIEIYDQTNCIVGMFQIIPDSGGEPSLIIGDAWANAATDI